jgi:hypothetical protein
VNGGVPQGNRKLAAQMAPHTPTTLGSGALGCLVMDEAGAFISGVILKSVAATRSTSLVFWAKVKRARKLRQCVTCYFFLAGAVVDAAVRLQGAVRSATSKSTDRPMR